MMNRKTKKLSSLYAMRQTALAILCVGCSLTAKALSAQAPTALRVGLVASAGPSDSVATSIVRGVRLGAAEAKQTANLFGGEVLLFEEASTGNPLSAANKLLTRRQVQVLIGSSARDADALSRFAESRRLIFFNTASRGPALRDACRRYTFHVEASDAMYDNALQRGAAAPGREVTERAVLWSPTLERYGASQVNDRYRAKYGAGMDGSAWAGWVALKIASEAALRARSAKPNAILSYLESPATTFDGHKGWPLSFRSSDHELRQPLYVLQRSSQPGDTLRERDVPELRELATSNTASASLILETLMPKPAAGCPPRIHK